MNKLVRDKIPEIIQQSGKEPVTRIADDAEYWQRLKDKLHEEVHEFVQDDDIDELADILEVIYALSEAKGVSKEELEGKREKKAAERGGFKDKVILEK